MTHDANELGINNYLYATNGVPTDCTAGQTSTEYGHAYNFITFTDGIITPPHDDTPGVFELKNPLDNVRGIVE